MQTSILILMLAFGVPGANSCTAQQQGLPRVGPTPAETGKPCDEIPAIVETHEADDSDSDMDDDSDSDADEADADDEMAEMVELPEMEVFNVAGEPGQECTAKCEGGGSCSKPSDPLGCTVQGLTLGNQIVRIKEKDLQGKLKGLKIQPGSTVIVETKNGQQVVLRAQGGAGQELATVNSLSPLTSLYGLAGMAQSAPQPQDERVRELEKRVHELEAQLRERDGQRVRSAPRAFTLRSPDARAEAELERAHAGEVRERMSAQARDYAHQARKQAEDIRRQTEQLRKSALDQAGQWRMFQQGEMAENMAKWKSAFPQGGEFHFTPPTPPVAEVAPVPAPQFGGFAYNGPDAPPVARRASKAPRAMRVPQAAGPEHAQEMQAMMEQMRTQMEEMRQQMQQLREELQNAPQREMR